MQMISVYLTLHKHACLFKSCVFLSPAQTCLSYLVPILERLNIEHEHWITLTTQFETCFKHAAGKVTHLEQYAQNQHQQRVQGRQSAMRLLG